MSEDASVPLRLTVSLAALAACIPPAVELEGKLCDANRTCPSGLPCNPFTLRCSRDQGCPLDASPAPCTGRDVFLAPGGANTETGLTSDAARRSLDGFPLRPGDRVHLAAGTYDYPLGASAPGTMGCPVQFLGAAGHASVFSRPLTLRDWWTLDGLTLDVPMGGSAVIADGTAGARSATVRNCRFRGDVDGLALSLDWCEQCEVRESHFEGRFSVLRTGTPSSGLKLVGNTMVTSSSLRLLDLNAPGATVEANRFTGMPRGSLVYVRDTSSTSRVARNVFHDFGGGATVFAVDGAPEVVSNTFVRLGSDSIASTGGVFRNNVVSQVTRATYDAPTDAGYNLLDGVETPYPGGASAATDLAGPAQLDDDFVPLEASPAVNAADPLLPVPPGGDARADIGALERGATKRADGRYCLP